VKLQKFSHCCVLASEAGSRLLIDPGCFSTGLETLGGLTGVLITHIHEDHLDISRLRALLASNPDARVVCDVASAAALADAGVEAEAVHAGVLVDLGVPVRVYGNEHAVLHPDLPNVPNVGYLIADRFFYGGDALTVPDRPVDVLALPVGAPWLKMAEAVEWLRVVRPRIAVPVHDYQHVIAEMAYHVLERLGPNGTRLMALSAGAPAEF
jgi:L-ascorbate metabolism protein UlaG (beta-lactamase superfamily)